MPLKQLIAPRRGEPIVEDTKASRRMAEYMELAASVINNTRMEVVELGDWDMNATASITVAHGLVYADIISARVFIRNDADTERHDIGTGQNATTTTQQGYVGSIGATLVGVTRLTGGKFDSASYSATSYNRGWLIITYINP